MIESGYKPDRLTYHLLLKLLCEDGRLELAVEVSKEMKARGYDIDLAASTMLIHLLCKIQRFEEAFEMFREMLQKGIKPQYLTFHRLNDELRKQGMTKMADKLCNMMSSVPHSTKLPNTYNVDSNTSRHARRALILRRGEAMSEVLKISKNPKRIGKLRKSSQNPVSSANQLIGEISQKVRETLS
uniref:Pentatricopeptide repeat-containing protein n=1 Tax=Rhizophora mucronata TaxID=61149 RepID=A0A2P2INA7_RHIMU